MKFLQIALRSLLILLPFQTLYITREVFLRSNKWQSGTLGFFATEILLWICIFIFGFWYAKKLHPQKKINFSFTSDRVFVLSLLLFHLYGFSSLIWSLDKSLALQQSLHVLEASLLFFLLFLGTKDWHATGKWFVAGASIQSLFGLYQFFTQSTFSFKWFGLVAHPAGELGTSVVLSGTERILRAYGAFSHPNILGGYLVLGLVLTILLLQKERGNRFLLGAFVLQSIGLFFTFSRSAWIGAILLFFGYGWFFCKNKKWDLLSLLGGTAFLLALFTFFYFPLIHTRVTQNTLLETHSTEERLTGYAQALQIFRQSPLLGVGAGNYTRALQEVLPDESGYYYQPVHNTQLLFVTEFGVLGALLFLFVLTRFYCLWLKDSTKKFQVMFLGGILVIVSLFDHYFLSSYTGLLLAGCFFAFFAHFSVYTE